jgi:ankyrin repeat protein
MNTFFLALLLVLCVPVFGMDNSLQESYWTRHVEGEVQVEFNNRKLTLYQRDMQFGPLHQAVCVDDIQLPAMPTQKTPECINTWRAQRDELRRQYRQKKSEQIKTLLESKKYDVNSIDTFGRTPLYYAARDGLIESVELLLRAGADPNIQEVVPRLRAGFDYPEWQRVNANTGTDLLYSPFEIAVAKGQYQVVSLLLEQGKCSDDTVRRALGIAEGIAEQYKNGPKELAGWDNKHSELIAKSKQKEYKSVPDYISHAACKYQLMQKIIGDLHSRLYPHASRALTGYKEPWFTAACEGDVATLKEMVSKPGYQGIDIVNNQDKTALLCAVENNQVNTVKWLLESGAKNQINDALFEAARMPQVPRDTYQITPAGNAAHNIMSQRRSMFELLLQHGAGINSRDTEGFTLLHRAVYDGQAPAVEELIDKHHAHIYELDSRGNTILHIAVGKGNTYLVTKILQHEHIVRAKMNEKDTKKYRRLQSVENNAGKKAEDLNDGLWKDEIEQELAMARLEGSMVMVDASPSESEKKLTDSLEDGNGFFEPKPVSQSALSAVRNKFSSTFSWVANKLPSSYPLTQAPSSAPTQMPILPSATQASTGMLDDDLLGSRIFEKVPEAQADEVMHQKEGRVDAEKHDDDTGFENADEGQESPPVDPLTASVIVSTAPSATDNDQGVSPDTTSPTLFDDKKAPEVDTDQDIIYQDCDDTIASLEFDDEDDDIVLDDTPHIAAQAHDVPIEKDALYFDENMPFAFQQCELKTIEPIPSPASAARQYVARPVVPRLRLPARVVPRARVNRPVDDTQQAQHFQDIFADTFVGQLQGNNSDPRLNPHAKKSNSVLLNQKLVPFFGAAAGVALVYVAAKNLYHTFCVTDTDTVTKNQQDGAAEESTEIAQPGTVR